LTAFRPVSWRVVTDLGQLRLHDTLTGAVRDFVPVRPGHASIYLCGATVQGLPHIGHVRSGVAFDVLRRWLTAKGLDVAFIRNVTDIDDKILTKAAAAGRPWWEWAATHERAFAAAYDALGVLPPSAKSQSSSAKVDRAGRVLEMLDGTEMTTGEISEELGISTVLTRPMLARMRKSGRIEYGTPVVRNGQTVPTWRLPP